MSILIITPEGKHSAENTQGRGPEYKILSILYETDGPVEFEEVAAKTGMDDEKCSMICRKLIKDGKIREV